MQTPTRWVLALTALVALCVPRSSYAQQMNFSYYSDYVFSEDGLTLYTIVDGSDNSTGCTHYNYQTTGYVSGPSGNFTQGTAGLSSYLGVPMAEGSFSFGSDLVLDCSCFGGGLGAGGGSSTALVQPMPNGEYSIPNAWAGPPFQTTFKWRAQLTSATSASFTGRTVREANGGNNVDACYDRYPNTNPGRMSIPTSGQWPVDGSSQYGDDFIGWLPDSVTFYRAHNAAPCAVEGDQRMQINQTGGRWATYKTNRIKGGIDVNGVWSYRDGQEEWKPY